MSGITVFRNSPTIKAFAATLLIRHASDGKKYLYDMIEIKRDKPTAKFLSNVEKTRAADAAANGLALDAIKSQPTQDVKTEFSLSPVTDKTESYRALAERVKKAGASDIKVTELTQRIKDLAEYATGAMYDPATVRARAEKIAEDVLNESYETTDEAETLKGIRSFLRDTAISYPSKTAPTSYDSFEEFRRKNMGRLKFSDEGRSVDSVYQELNVRETMSAEDIEGITQDIVEQILGSDALTKQPTTPKKINLPERARQRAAEDMRYAERKLSRAMAAAFDLPDMVSQNGLAGIARQISTEYIRAGRV